MPKSLSHSVLSKKVFVFDLDLTLWSHEDAQSTVPPYMVEGLRAVDTRGDVVELYECVPRLFRKLKELGKKIAIASWNAPEAPLELLRVFGLAEHIDYAVIEPHPYKTSMLMRIMTRLAASPDEVVFFDDNEEIAERVAKNLGIDVYVIGRDIKHICELAELLDRHTALNCPECE